MKSFPWNMFHVEFQPVPKNVINLAITLSVHDHKFQGFVDMEAKCYSVTLCFLFYELHLGVFV